MLSSSNPSPCTPNLGEIENKIKKLHLKNEFPSMDVQIHHVWQGLNQFQTNLLVFFFYLSLFIYFNNFVDLLRKQTDTERSLFETSLPQNFRITRNDKSLNIFH